MMISNRLFAFATALSLAAAAFTVAPRAAEACGGCFVPPEEATQVTGHNMILSVGMTQQSLYDQIEYAGDPAEFAWVLPIKGTVEVGISSDAVFQALDESTRVVVNPPPLNCGITSCNSSSASTGGFGNEGSGGGGGGVDVLAQATVGPYETVQLSASDPDALYAWMSEHGYNVPEEIAPIIDDYIAGDFNFLAMRLVPGVGVDKMAPVRITAQGAGVSLPLKMVAAGTGATTIVTLYVVGEGRYEPTNFPTFQIDESALIWNWDLQKSNYSDLRQQGYEASNGFAWLVEQTGPMNPSNFSSWVQSSVEFNLEESGYETLEDAEEDLQTLFAGMNQNSVVVTRLRAELSRPALANDLTVGAADDQSVINGWYQVQKAVGNDPCPPPPVCDDDGLGSGTSSSSGGLGNGSSGKGRNRDGGSCAMVMDRNSAASAAGGLGVFALALIGLGIRRRRRAS